MKLGVNLPSMIDNSINFTPSLKFPLPVGDGGEWCNNKKRPSDTISLQIATKILSFNECRILFNKVLTPLGLALELAKRRQ